jgi:hypothetical protein
VSSAKEVEERLKFNYETRAFEVKGPGLRSHKAFLAKVVRAALAMGNLPDGGRVCIGIDNKKMAAMQPGLDATQFAEWSSFDAVTGAFTEYADPPLQLAVWPMSLSSGVQVVVIDVEEFRDIPHFCRRDYPGLLRRGALYVAPSWKAGDRRGVGAHRAAGGCGVNHREAGSKVPADCASRGYRDWSLPRRQTLQPVSMPTRPSGGG